MPVPSVGSVTAEDGHPTTHCFRGKRKFDRHPGTTGLVSLTAPDDMDLNSV
jgi:hypothetical protein